jgi:hypothetical protein
MTGLGASMKSSVVLTSAALVLSASGLALVFAPGELTAESSAMMAQLLGASLIGLGSADWMARKSSAGGIYGRSLVVANTMTFGISALVMARVLIRQEKLELLVAAAVAAILCAGFLYLLSSHR